MNNRKYPTSLFVFGLILNLMKTWYLAVVSFLIYIFSNISSLIPFWLPIMSLCVWLVLAFIKQLKYRKTILTKSDNEEINNLWDKVFDTNNPNWRKTLIDDVNETIEQYSKSDKLNM